MAADDVFPRRNLGPGEEWGRTVEDRLVVVERQADISRTGLSGQNRSTAASLESLARQLAEIEAQNAAIAAQNVAILANQAAISSEISFLQSASVSDGRGTLTTFTGASAGTIWSTFDGTYDCSITLATSSSGRVSVDFSAFITGGGLTGMVALEIVGVTGPSGPLNTGSCSVVDATVVASRVGLIYNLAPNTSYTFNLRRGRDGSASGAVAWGYQTLAVTRLR